MDSLEQARRRVQRGEVDAFQSIVEQTSDMLVRLSARMLGNVTDAEDVVQEAFVKAYRALANDEFDGRSSVKTWLYRIVTNASLDALRKRKRGVEVADDVLPERQSTSSPAQLEARLALRELSDYLDGLPEEQRVAILLKGVEGLTTSEIAAIMNSSEGAVEQRLVRARAYLRGRRNET